MIKPAFAANEIVNNALSDVVKTKSAGSGLAFYIAQLWKTVVLVGGLAFLLYLVWGGLQWLTAGGDKGKIEEAQHKITNALIGLAILVLSFAVVLFVQAVFKINLLKPEFPNAL
ncbi:hypothetical protein HY333_01580 [Candidatus Collierbacteria bacterium]|nr:hypothetical protein [Candidatus Collierbacteria bacterium]